MNFRLIASLFVGLSLAITPAYAKKKPKLEEMAEAAPVAVTTVVDVNPANDPENVLYLDLSSGGRVAVRLMPQWAPNHVERIKTLARQGFYDGVIFHRVIEGFMAQTGDPTGTGTGGSQLPDMAQEFNPMPHVRGTLSMARAARGRAGRSRGTRNRGCPGACGSWPCREGRGHHATGIGPGRAKRNGEFLQAKVRGAHSRHAG